jgi:hypothetical protein
LYFLDSVSKKYSYIKFHKHLSGGSQGVPKTERTKKVRANDQENPTGILVVLISLPKIETKSLFF